MTAADKEFMTAALHLIEDTLIMAEAMRLLPKIILRYVHPTISRRLAAG
jgi:hypothetical protein